MVNFSIVNIILANSNNFITNSLAINNFINIKDITVMEASFITSWEIINIITFFQYKKILNFNFKIIFFLYNNYFVTIKINKYSKYINYIFLKNSLKIKF